MGHRAGVTGETHHQNPGTRWPASVHDASRFILDQLPGCSPVDATPTEPSRYSPADEPPILVTPDLIEPPPFRAIQVADLKDVRGHSGFAAFLDGTQDLRVVNQIEGISIVWGVVSAAIRARVHRRLVCWAGRPPIVSGRYYMPFRYLPALRDEMRNDPRVVDTATEARDGTFPSRHPAALMEAAVKRIQSDRERIELELAESWCASQTSTLYVDGSITGSRIAASSIHAVGVSKTHRRLYAEGDAFRILAGLRAGERTTVFRVDPRDRHPVASWYVRLRNPAGRDALFGLVRVEAALTSDISSRADEVTRWVLAEGAPLALPDGRWDKMAYGVRDTEEFLRAIS
ncbi:MAG TPA: hypothetical protein VHM24_05340 [Gemmatimonadaceae bacterium]|nr:hypothetical protein [Gemmatimonadaceae bacterium]